MYCIHWLYRARRDNRSAEQCVVIVVNSCRESETKTGRFADNNALRHRFHLLRVYILRSIKEGNSIVVMVIRRSAWNFNHS